MSSPLKLKIIWKRNKQINSIYELQGFLKYRRDGMPWNAEDIV